MNQHGERLDALDQRWPALLWAAGLEPVAFPNVPELVSELARAHSIDGVVLTGGNDLAVLGGDAPERDRTELALIEFARERQLPLLAVCRGMQLLQHEAGTSLERVEGHVAPTQALDFEGRAECVNSYHLWGSRADSPGYRTLARTPDGIVKSIEHESLPILAIMWHPERIEPFAERDLELLRGHFRATPFERATRPSTRSKR